MPWNLNFGLLPQLECHTLHTYEVRKRSEVFTLLSLLPCHIPTTTSLARAEGMWAKLRWRIPLTSLSRPTDLANPHRWFCLWGWEWGFWLLRRSRNKVTLFPISIAIPLILFFKCIPSYYVHQNALKVQNNVPNCARSNLCKFFCAISSLSTASMFSFFVKREKCSKYSLVLSKILRDTCQRPLFERRYPLLGLQPWLISLISRCPPNAFALNCPSFLAPLYI